MRENVPRDPVLVLAKTLDFGSGYKGPVAGTWRLFFTCSCNFPSMGKGVPFLGHIMWQWLGIAHGLLHGEHVNHSLLESFASFSYVFVL